MNLCDLCADNFEEIISFGGFYVRKNLMQTCKEIRDEVLSIERDYPYKITSYTANPKYPDCACDECMDKYVDDDYEYDIEVREIHNDPRLIYNNEHIFMTPNRHGINDNHVHTSYNSIDLTSEEDAVKLKKKFIKYFSIENPEKMKQYFEFI